LPGIASGTIGLASAGFNTLPGMANGAKQHEGDKVIKKIAEGNKMAGNQLLHFIKQVYRSEYTKIKTGNDHHLNDHCLFVLTVS